MIDLIHVLQWFRKELLKEKSKREGDSLVTLIEFLAGAHGSCLQEMESRLARWESNARHNIGDYIYNALLSILPLYDQYLENLMPVLEKFEYSMRTSKHFDQLCRDFELQKHCYLPLTSFLLKPLQRLIHYSSIINSKNFLHLQSLSNYRDLFFLALFTLFLTNILFLFKKELLLFN
jgi:FERM/RhoGEF/pleckstrin domain protein 2